MDKDVQAFKDKMAEKAAAKEKVMEALGAARLAESQGKDASKFWEVVAEQGIKGVEGKAMAEAQKLADAYVQAHPEQFALLADQVTPEMQAFLQAQIGRGF